MNQERKQVIVFFIGTIMMSFCIFWGPIAFFKIPTVNLISGEMGPVWALILFMIGGFIPSLVGIFLTGYYDGKKGLKALFKSSVDVKLGSRGYGSCIGAAIVMALGLLLVAKISGADIDYTQFYVQLPTLLPLIVLGPISEEFGWRGFALKRLLKVTSPGIASLLIGLVWSMWHLPLFHMLGTSQYEGNMSFTIFLINVTSMSLIYTYLALKSKNNLFSALFLHWVTTYVMQVVSTSVVRTPLFNYLECLPLLLIGMYFFWKLKRNQGERIVTRQL